MIKSIFKELFSSFKGEAKLLTLFALPGTLLAAFGYWRVYGLSGALLTVGLAQKYCLEFFFLASALYFLHFFGFRKKWFYITLMFIYMVCNMADFTLLLYFKERFGLKYLSTLDTGADFNFFKDWRLIALFIFVLLFCWLPVKKYLKNISKPQAFFKFAPAVFLALFFAFVPFYNLLSAPKNFYAKYMLAPSVAYILKGVLARGQKPLFELTPAAAPLAEKYALFAPAPANPAPQEYERIILLTVEALSAKFINSYNPGVPPEASSAFDALIKENPAALVATGALSTLYGLSIIYAGHPNALLSYKNSYPLSLVKMLGRAGYKTAFLRGAAEDYMDEDLHLRAAGFEENYGKKYFSARAAYKDYIGWWGLTDRKLFDYALEYLKEHKGERVFVNILTLDTHVPLGRPDYFDQQYPPYPAKKAYARRSLAQAFFRLNHDLGLFIDNLKREGLLDEKTLLVVTGDHPFYENVNIRRLVRPYKAEYDWLPVIFAGNAPEIVPDSRASQADIAPSILYLLGLEKPRAMFGKDLFHAHTRALFDIKEDYLKVSDAAGTKVMPLTTKKNKGYVDLAATFLEK